MNTTSTIGMDLGNKNHKAVGLGPDGQHLFREQVANTPESVREFFVRHAGAYFGLVPRQDQSGDMDRLRHITKEGNEMARRNLVTAANHILRDSSKETVLKSFGLRVRGPGNGQVAKRRAKTAVARKLSVVMAAMLKSSKPYNEIAGKGKRA